MDLISVIIPVYNVEKYLLRCVDSVLEQSYENLEIILVDDESPDSCPELCEKLKEKDSRIKLIHKKNGGLGFARNSGLDEVTGKYVTFVDSDDWIEKTHIETLYNCAKKNDADACFCGYTVAFDVDKTVSFSKGKAFVCKGEEITENILKPLIGATPSEAEDVPFQASVCMALYKTEIIKKHSLRFVSEKEIIAEDVFFNIEFALKADCLAGIENASYFYYVNDNSISKKYSEKRLERTVAYYNHMQDVLKLHGLDGSEYILRAQRSFLMKIRVIIIQIVSSDLNKKQKAKAIDGVLQNDLVQSVLDAYPISSAPKDKRFVLSLMKDKHTKLLYMIFESKQKLDKSPALVSFFRKVRGLK